MSKVQELKELLSLLGDLETVKAEDKSYSSRLEIGKNYLIRTVTMIQVGRFVEVDNTFNLIILEDASWIADTGRFHDCLKTGEFDEVEPFPDWAGVGIGTIIDIAPFPHTLPKIQK